jgi:hypothetical protein
MVDDPWSADEWVLDRVEDRAEAEPTGDRGIKSPVWVGIGELLRVARSGPYTREQVIDAVEAAAADGEVYYWRGLLAPADDAHLEAIVENERQCDRPNQELIDAVDAFRQEEIRREGATDTAEVATSGGESR